MARPLRIDLPGAGSHLTARGTERGAIFRQEGDCWHFLELLEEGSERYALVLHAYLLMENHYPLMVETPQANLSAAMQWLGLSYGDWFNRRHRAGLVDAPERAVAVDPEGRRQGQKA